MDVDLNDITLVNNLQHLALDKTNTVYYSDIGLVDTMSSLRLDNPESFETFYDYDKTTTKPNNTNTNTDTHTYIETHIDTNTDIIRENIDEDNEEEDEQAHAYDEYDYIVPDDDMIDKYDTSPYLCFGIPNKYCHHYFDDEDFIYNRYDITIAIKNYIKINNSIDEYTSHFCIGNGIMIDYNNNNDNPDVIYAKILYIYNYINYYYKDLRDLPPNERIKHLPEHFLYWVDNIVTIFQKVINDESLKLDTFLSIEDVYFKELCYGLKIITHHLELLLNHYKSYSLWRLEDKHIKLFFKIVNNMCVIIIFMKLNNRS